MKCTGCKRLYHHTCLGIEIAAIGAFKCKICLDPEFSTLSRQALKSRPKHGRTEDDKNFPKMSMYYWNLESQVNAFREDISAIRKVDPTKDSSVDSDVEKENIPDSKLVPMDEDHVVVFPENLIKLLNVGTIKKKVNVPLAKVFEYLNLEPFLKEFQKQCISTNDLILLSEADFETLLPLGPRRKLQAWILGIHSYILAS